MDVNLASISYPFKGEDQDLRRMALPYSYGVSVEDKEGAWFVSGV